MTRRDLLALSATPLLAQTAATGRKLLILSIDGLDHRYLRDADKLGLRIPTLRRLMKEGLWADGVLGEVPTVTWPSHTTMLTGVPPRVHGILSNRRPASEGGEYYWDLDLCKVPTLWHAARKAGAKTAAITWPVSVTPIIDFNFPEYFQRRRGGAMDLKSIESKSTPGLVAKISRTYPSFTQEWMDDRTRALATIWLLKNERPDLFAVHFVDHDSDAHANGPFTREATATLEYDDELIGQILESLPPRTVVAVVSDHGFSRIRRSVNLKVLQSQRNLLGSLQMTAGLVVAKDEAGAAALDVLRKDPAIGIGRTVGVEERVRFAPELRDAKAAFEPAEGFVFESAASGEPFVEHAAKGEHGLWPGRPEYRASLLLWGSGVKAGRLPEVPMTGHAKRFAEVLGLTLPA